MSVFYEPLRRERDSNPRCRFRHTSFPGMPIKPLSHLSIITENLTPLLSHFKIGKRPPRRPLFSHPLYFFRDQVMCRSISAFSRKLSNSSPVERFSFGTNAPPERIARTPFNGRTRARLPKKNRCFHETTRTRLLSATPCRVYPRNMETGKKPAPPISITPQNPTGQGHYKQWVCYKFKQTKILRRYHDSLRSAANL